MRPMKWFSAALLVLALSANAHAAVLFEDQFNGTSGQAPDSLKWYMENNCHGSGGQELQVYTRRSQNVALNGSGQLRISALRENMPCDSNGDGTAETFNYTSARIMTADRPIKAGRVLEARIKTKRQSGVGPALWGSLWGESWVWPRDGEWDVEFNPTCISLGIIGANPASSTQDWPLARCDAPPWDSAGDEQFHDYKVEFRADRLTFYFDGLQRFEVKQADYAGTWPWDRLSYPVILNVAVGGTRPWGNPTAATVFPSEMQVDYIRISDIADTPPPTEPPPTTPPGVLMPASALAKSSRWTIDGSDIYTFFNNEWVEYQITAPAAGDYLLKLKGRNEPYSGAPNVPPSFSWRIKVQVDGTDKGNITLPCAAANTEASMPLTLPAGDRRIRLTVLDDAYAAGQYDSNLRLTGIALDPAQPVPPVVETYRMTLPQCEGPCVPVSGAPGSFTCDGSCRYYYTFRPCGDAEPVQQIDTRTWECKK